MILRITLAKLIKPVCASALSFILLNSHLQALEVGDIELQSKLGQPLLAVIQLTDNAPVTDQEIIINKAPAEIYQQMGIDTASQFLDLKFELKSNGQLYLTTKAPINEPYLNFILQFRWPDGEVNREFKLLVDPS